MGSDEVGRLLIYTHIGSSFDFDFDFDFSLPPADLIELTALMQRQFPDHPVAAADLEWLYQTVRQPLPLPSKRPPEEALDALLEEAPLAASSAAPAVHAYVYLVLGWLGGTVSKQVAEQAIKAAADAVREWMRARRSKDQDITQTAYILGPNGKVLKKVDVRPKSPARWRKPRRRSESSST
jgi:hypothetical protein